MCFKLRDSVGKKRKKDQDVCFRSEGNLSGRKHQVDEWDDGNNLNY